MKKKIGIFLVLMIFTLILSACSGLGTSTSKSTLPTESTTFMQEKVSTELSTGTSDTAISSNSNQYTVGNSIRFGGYEWLILDVRDGKALLLTKEIIAFRYGNISNDAKEALTSLTKETIGGWSLSDYEGYKFNNPKFDGIYEAYLEYTSVHPEIFNEDMWYTSWESCSLRTWLNSEMEFTPDEWNMIETTEIIDRTGLGANTSDKVFLLESDDVEKYFPRNESRVATCMVSDEEILYFLQHTLLMGTLSRDLAEKVLNTRNRGDFYWWVRGSAPEESYLKLMSSDDELFSMPGSLEKPLGVRPAIWIRINE